MSPRIFITATIDPTAAKRLRDAGMEVLENHEDRNYTREELVRLGAGCDALLTQLTDKVDGALLDALPTVRAVAQVAVGYNNIDVAAATQRHVLVTNTPDVLTEATADIAWALLLGAARRIAESDAWLRAGNWKGWSPSLFLGADVVGKTLGIVGAGRIGAATARRAMGWNMRVLYSARTRKPELEKTGAEWRELDDLLRESDYVSVHCPLLPETKHLIDARRLALMKPTAILVNTARGPIVDEAALIAALREGRLAAAGLDVYENEPTVPAELIALPNTVLIPHLGSATTGTRRAMALLAADNLVAFFAGKRPPTMVNPDVWAG